MREVRHNIRKSQESLFRDKGEELGGIEFQSWFQPFRQSDGWLIVQIAFRFEDSQKGEEYYEWGIKNNMNI